MKITPIKTHTITTKDTIEDILEKYLPKIPEKCIVALASKIVAITEGRVVGKEVEKDELIQKESRWYLPGKENPYGVSLTIKNNTLVANAGIDESNAEGGYVLWPKDPQASANRIRKWLRERGKVGSAFAKASAGEVGVMITDSKTTPLRWGVTGFAIAYSGFLPLKDYVGTPDLFGRPFQFEKLSIVDSLAASAVVAMGEGAEQTPLAVVTDIPFVTFVDHDPTDEELATLQIDPKVDLYAPFLKSVAWKKGKS